MFRGVKMNKKADLSINIIVIAAIALIILVIVSVLLFRSGGDLRQGTSCEGIGGVCVYDSDYRSCSEYADFNYLDSHRRHPTASCPNRDQFCCVPI